MITNISDATKKRIPYMIAIIILIYIIKPSFFFTPNGSMRSYGLGSDSDGYNKSLYSFHYFLLIIGVFLFFIIN